MLMSQLHRNIVANFIGNGWTAAMSIVFVPIYIHFIGIEAYGLMGVYASLQAMFSLLDMGLSTTLNRETARLGVQPNKAQDMRNLLRTLEVAYWMVAAFIGVTVFLLAPVIAHHWVKAQRLSPATIQQSIMIMGLAMAFQWPLSFYSGGLLGLQRQVLLNAIMVSMATLRNVGVILILWMVSPTIQAFFLWQIFIGAFQTLIVAWFLWRSLPPTSEHAHVQIKLLHGIWRFAAGMSGITVLSLILTQLDKIILSKMLTLEMFGYYTLAGAVAMSLYRFISPIFNATYPRFTQLVTVNDQNGLIKLYHSCCQLMSVVIIPSATIVAFFSAELLSIWTRNPLTVEHTHTILSLLVIGTALNGLMNLPFALQLAYGWTKLAFYVNLGAIIILGPMIFFMTAHYGAVGAALVWVFLNSGYVLISIRLMHHRLLKGEQWRWYLEDVGLPLAASLGVVGLGCYMMGTDQMPLLNMIVSLTIISVTAFTAAAFAAPLIRTQILMRISQLRISYGPRYG